MCIDRPCGEQALHDDDKKGQSTHSCHANVVAGTVTQAVGCDSASTACQSVTVPHVSNPSVDFDSTPTPHEPRQASQNTLSVSLTHGVTHGTQDGSRASPPVLEVL